MNKAPDQRHHTTRLELAYLYGGVVHYRPGENLPSRVLSDFELVLIIEGHVTYRADGRDHAAPPGSVILARPGSHEGYLWDTAAPTRHAYFHFDIESMPEDWPPVEKWPVIQPHPDAVVGALFRHVVQRICTHPEWPAASPGPDDCRLVESLISVFLRPQEAAGVELERNRSEPVNRVLNFMREVIDTNPHRPVRLSDLAAVAGTTEKHLCRLFHHALGHPPMATFRLLRLQLAVALLARSNLTVKEVADRCGFDNPLYFSRLFAKVYREPPTETRKRLLMRGTLPANPLPVDITPRLHW